MTPIVHLRSFKRDRQTQFRWQQSRSADSVEDALAWDDALMDALAELAASAFPKAHALAHESDRLPDGPYRVKLFGVGAGPTHRILFRVTAAEIQLVAIRHLAQADLTGDDL